MLLDYAILHQTPEPLVRCYSWAAPTLSLGRHQKVGEEILASCAGAGVEVVRRPTGGTAVLHNGDVTYSVVAPYGALGVLDAYMWVARGLISAFKRLSLTAVVVEHEALLHPSPVCFATPMGADLAVRGSKVCGSAQVRSKGWFLQHGSIPISDQRTASAQLLGVARSGSSTCMDLLRPGTSQQDITDSLVHGFADAWGEYREVGLAEFESWASSSLMLA